MINAILHHRGATATLDLSQHWSESLSVLQERLFFVLPEELRLFKRNEGGLTIKLESDNDFGKALIKLLSSKDTLKDAYIKVVFVEPNKPAVVAEIENKLRGLQRAVGGNIEAIYFKDGTCLICNEEGKLKGLKGNRRLTEFGDEVIAGVFFITGIHEDEFRSLTEEEIEKYMSRFKEPEEIPDEEVREDIGIKFKPL